MGPEARHGGYVRDMGVLDRLDRRNQRLVDEQREPDPARFIPPGVVAIISGVSLVWIALWCLAAAVGAASFGWSALFIVSGAVLCLVLFRDVIADVRDMRHRRRG